MDPAGKGAGFGNADSPDDKRPSNINIRSVFERKWTRSYDQIPLINVDERKANFDQSKVSLDPSPARSHVSRSPDAKSEATLDRDHLPPKSFRQSSQWRGWRRPLQHFGIFFALFLLSYGLIQGALMPNFLAKFWGYTFPIGRTRIEIPAPSCLPPLGSFVGIDVPVWHFSFAGAKAVDLLWNAIVGRGVQLLLAALAYRVFADGLMKALETQSVPLEAVISLSLFATQPVTLWRLLVSLFRAPGWRVKMLMFWALLSTIFLLAFPSLLDLASGYDSRQNLYLVQPGGVTTQLDNSTRTSRSASDAAIRTSIGDLYTADPDNYTVGKSDEGDEYRFYHVQWKNPNLQSSWDSFYTESYVKEKWNKNIGGAAPRFYLSDANNYQCNVEPEAYVWGFAFAWLIVSAGLTTGWLIGLWMFWVDADHNSQMCRKRRRMGPYRAIVDVGETLRAELGEELGAYSERELRKAVEKRVRGVKYVVEEREEDGAPRVRLATGQSERVRLEWNRPYA